MTKALRGVFVSSLKLAAFHAGFTWLTLRAFGTHFVCTATVTSGAGWHSGTALLFRQSLCSAHD